MDVQAVKEKRQYQRMALNRLVRIREESGQTLKLVGINYSLGGMALHSKVPFPFGEFIELQFRINEKEEELNMTAEVMQNFRRGDIYITGVKFVGELPLN